MSVEKKSLKLESRLFCPACDNGIRYDYAGFCGHINIEHKEKNIPRSMLMWGIMSKLDELSHRVYGTKADL